MAGEIGARAGQSGGHGPRRRSHGHGWLADPGHGPDGRRVWTLDTGLWEPFAGRLGALVIEGGHFKVWGKENERQEADRTDRGRACLGTAPARPSAEQSAWNRGGRGKSSAQGGRRRGLQDGRVGTDGSLAGLAGRSRRGPGPGRFQAYGPAPPEARRRPAGAMKSPPPGWPTSSAWTSSPPPLNAPSKACPAPSSCSSRTDSAGATWSVWPSIPG